MKNKIRLIVKSCIFPLIMCIITLLIGIYLFRSTAIGIHLNEQLIILFIAFFPVFVFLLITVLFYHFRESHKKEFRIALKIITVVLSCLLIFYYFIALFACALLASGSPVTDPKYYEHYVSGKRLEKAFPPEIPDNAVNVNFYYAPGANQLFFVLY